MIKLIKRKINKLIRRKKCYICGEKFFAFRKSSRTPFNLPKSLNMIGSDENNFGCVYCNSTDRERHLFLFFDKLYIWDKMISKKVLHIAPEKHLSEKIKGIKTIEYIKGDISPKTKDIKRIDITSIPYRDNHFDILICNHVLEHVLDYKLALFEIRRVLKPNGLAILQTPYSEYLQNNFENPEFTDIHLHTYFFGQYDHVRIFSKNVLLNSILNTGFNSLITEHSEISNEFEANYWGMNYLENLLLFKKI